MAKTPLDSRCRCPGRNQAALTRRELLAASANGFGLGWLRTVGLAALRKELLKAASSAPCF